MKNGNEKKRYKSSTIAIDEEMAAQLDRAMIAFGLESRSATCTIAVRAWLAAVLEDETIHQMVRLAVRQTRENEFAALREFYEKRAADFAQVVDVQRLRDNVMEGT